MPVVDYIGKVVFMYVLWITPNLSFGYQPTFLQVKDKLEKEEKEWADRLERERARTLNKVYD